ncbi:IPT/TIG domain-containing protein [Anthocerotibacter panamensis]|uniref:IPT/TIG domain-containing protein n=1 Tax=Anthocerotibacter panamensis TaxID=2857077 RepID=UPI001C4031E4|nr:IPT/TIG domain-containing protein [Anthocerotibacter panamensis]
MPAKLLSKYFGYFLIGWMVFILPGSPLLAQTVFYSYDGDGRLIQVTNANGSKTTYEYDDANNIIRVTNVNTTTFALTSFTPDSASVGTSVTISGTGFVSPTVAFNGVPAVLINSTATTISTTVPAGATTGALTVTVNGQTLTAGTFTVLALPGPPVLGAYSLPVAQPGDTITLSGSGFNPASRGAYGVKVGATTATVTAVTSTGIAFTVPSIPVANNPPTTPGTAQTVTVQIGAGVATAPRPLYLVPRVAFKVPVDLSSGSAAGGTLGAYGDNGAFLVSGGGGSRALKVNVTGINGSGYLRLFVFRPDNTLQQTISSSIFGNLVNGSFQITATLDLSLPGQYVIQPVFDYDSSRGFQATGAIGIGTAPSLGSYSSPVAQPGDTITLAGSGFDTTPGGTVVKVGTTTATVTTIANNQVTFVVPAIAIPNNPPGTPGTAMTVTVQNAAGPATAPYPLYLVPRIRLRNAFGVGSSTTGTLSTYGDNGLFLTSNNTADRTLMVNATEVNGSGYLRVFIFRPDGSLQQTITLPATAFTSLNNGSFQANVGPLDLTNGGQYFFQAVFDFNSAQSQQATGTVTLGLSPALSATNGLISVVNPVDTTPVPLPGGVNGTLSVLNPDTATSAPTITAVNGFISIDNPNSIFASGSPAAANAPVSVYNPPPAQPTNTATAVNGVLSVYNAPPAPATSTPSGVNAVVSTCNPGSGQTCP